MVLASASIPFCKPPDVVWFQVFKRSQTNFTPRVRNLEPREKFQLKEQEKQVKSKITTEKLIQVGDLRK